MNKINQTHPSRGLLWVALIFPLGGASFAFLQYAGWSAVYSAYFGLPSEAHRVVEAGRKAQYYGGTAITLAVAAITMVMTLLHRSDSWAGSSGTKGLNILTRLALTSFLVVLILIGAAGISTIGHYVK
jgi:hypothetical protein